MSSTVVRTQFRSALVAQFPAVPYVETLGTEVDEEALPALWMSMAFAAGPDERLSIGTPCYWEETGVCRVMVAGLAGAGDAAVSAQADAVAEFFRNWQVPAESLRVTGVTPPSTGEDDSDGRWLYFVIDLAYVRGFFA